MISLVAQCKFNSCKKFEFTTANIKHLTGFRSNELQYNFIKKITRCRVTNISINLIHCIITTGKKEF